MSGTRGGGLHPVEEQFRELGEPYRVEAWAAKYEPGALDTGAAGVLADYESTHRGSRASRRLAHAVMGQSWDMITRSSVKPVLVLDAAGEKRLGAKSEAVENL